MNTNDGGNDRTDEMIRPRVGRAVRNERKTGFRPLPEDRRTSSEVNTCDVRRKMVCVAIHAVERLQRCRHNRPAVSLSENERFVRLKSYWSLFSNRFPVFHSKVAAPFRSSALHCRLVRCGSIQPPPPRSGNLFLGTPRPRSSFVFRSSSPCRTRARRRCPHVLLRSHRVPRSLGSVHRAPRPQVRRARPSPTLCRRNTTRNGTRNDVPYRVADQRRRVNFT